MKLQPRPTSSVQNWLLVEVCRLCVSCGRCGGEPAPEEKVNEPDRSRLGGKRGLVLGCPADQLEGYPFCSPPKHHSPVSTHGQGTPEGCMAGRMS
jgi:hypothetical protein